MSVKLNTNTTQGVASNGVPSDKPKPNLLHWCVDAAYEGALKERLSPKDYCQRIWKQEQGAPPIENTEAFRDCIEDVIQAVRFAKWSRHN